MMPRRREGFAMPAVIGALVIIGILVTAGFYMARQELRIGVASNHANMAVNIAQAGANEVMANWNGYQLGNIAPWDSTTITGAAYGGTWSVKIHNANNFVYFLTATGNVTDGGALWAGASRTIGITTRILFADIDPPAALTTRGPVELGGNSEVNGTNVTPPTWGPYCAGLATDDMTGIMLDDVVGTPPSTKGSNPYASGSATLAGNPPFDEDPTIVDETFTTFGDMTFEELVTFAQIEGKDVTGVGSFNGIAPTTTGSPARCNTANLLNWGDTIPTNPCGAYFPLIYRNGAMTIQSNSYGQGILLVEGDLEMRGGFTFFGIVIVQGSFVTGNGGATIYGAVLASNSANLEQDLTGGGEVHYSRCAVTRAVLNNASLSRARPLDNRSWVDLTAAVN